jgi:hypothetical protein
MAWRADTGARPILTIRPRLPDPPPPSLDELIRRLARLRPCWTRPEMFFEARSEFAHDLRQLARSGSSGAPSRPAGPSEAERRLVALARGLAGEVERLRRLLGDAARARPRRRRQAPDDRQMALPV